MMRFKILLLCGVMTALSACGGGATKTATSDHYQPAGILKVGNPYEVLGQKYTPEHHTTYEEIGIASWYGPGFHGKATANGDRFDQHAMTAAHRTLPMPSVVEVTNLENGRTAVLTVNDRGPFSKERIIDLSKASADKLGVISNGTAKVRVRYLHEESVNLIQASIKSGKLKADEKTLAAMGLSSGGAPVVPQQPDSKFSLVSSAYADEPAFTGGSGVVSDRANLTPVTSRDLEDPYASAEPAPAVQENYAQSATVAAVSGSYVQVASFSQSQNAQEMAQKLAPIGRASVQSVDISGKTWYRVRLGPLADSSSANNVLAAVRGMGIPDARIVHQ